ncbi:hypothetical protein D3C72_1204470 [compost metagenome]
MVAGPDHRRAAQAGRTFDRDRLGGPVGTGLAGAGQNLVGAGVGHEGGAVGQERRGGVEAGGGDRLALGEGRAVGRGGGDQAVALDLGGEEEAARGVRDGQILDAGVAVDLGGGSPAGALVTGVAELEVHAVAVGGEKEVHDALGVLGQHGGLIRVVGRLDQLGGREGLAVGGGGGVEVALADVGADVDHQPLAVGAAEKSGLGAALGAEADLGEALATEALGLDAGAGQRAAARQQRAGEGQRREEGEAGEHRLSSPEP